MKLLAGLNVAYYLCLLAYILAIPEMSFDGFVSKVVFFLLTIGFFVFLLTFYIIISFNKKNTTLKKYYNFNNVVYCVGFFGLVVYGPNFYYKTNNLNILLGVVIFLFIASNLIIYKIKTVSKYVQFDFWRDAKLFYAMGQSLEKTPLSNAINKLDYLLTVFAVLLAIAESIYVFAAGVGVILLLSIKYLMILKREFLNSGLISVKETYFSIISYNFFYLFSIFWAVFFPNFTTLLIGGLGLLFIKIYIRRIAEKVYEETIKGT